MKIKKFSEFNSNFISVSPFYEQGEPFQLDLDLGDSTRIIRTRYTKYKLIYDFDRYVKVNWLSLPLDHPEFKNNLGVLTQEFVDAITKITSQRFWDWRGIILPKPTNKIENNFFSKVRKIFNGSNLWTENERSDFIVYIYDQS